MRPVHDELAFAEGDDDQAMECHPAGDSAPARRNGFYVGLDGENADDYDGILFRSKFDDFLGDVDPSRPLARIEEASPA